MLMLLLLYLDDVDIFFLSTFAVQGDLLILRRSYSFGGLGAAAAGVVHWELSGDNFKDYILCMAV